MANVGYATLQVIPSLKGLDRSMSKGLTGPLGVAGTQAGDSASRGFRSKFSTGVKVAGVAAAGALAGGFGAVFAVLRTGVGEVKDASAGIAQLQAGIKSTGNVANVSVPQLEDLASSIQAFSGQTDDSIVASEKLLLTFTNIRNSAGKGNDIFNQATLATADLAAKMGGDASDSAIQLGKALNDPVKGITALTRVGVSFTQGQKDQIKALVATGDVMGAQKIILKELNTEFGGAAKAAGESIPGQLERAKRSFEDLSQGVVQALVPVVLPAVNALSAGLKLVAPIAERASTAVSKALGSLAGKASLGIKALFKSFKDGDVTSDGFVGVMERLGVALRDFLPRVKASIGQLVPIVQKVVGQVVDLFVGHLLPLFLNLAKVIVPAVVDIGKNVSAIFSGSILPAFKEFVDFASAYVVPIVARIVDAISAFVGLLARHQGPVKVFAKVALGLLVVRFAALKINAAVVGIQRFGKEIASNIQSVKAFAKSLKKGIESTAEFAKGMLRGAANIAKQTAKIVAQTAVFLAQKTAMLAAAAAQKVLTAAQWLLNAAMTANPIGLIVAAVAALAVGVFVAYKKFKPFRDIVNAVGRAFAAVAKVITGGLTAAFNWIKSHWPLLLAILTGPVGLAVLAFKKFGPQILSAVTSAFNAIVSFFAGLPARIVGALGSIGSLLLDLGKRIVGGLLDGARFMLGVYLDFYVKLPLKILAKLAGAASWLLNVGKRVIGGFLRGVVNGFAAVLTFFARLELRVLRALGAVATWLLNAGAKVMAGLLRGIADGAVTVFGFFFRLPGRILAFFAGAGKWLTSIGKGILLGLGNGIVEGAGLVLGWLSGIPGRILGAIGDLGGLLWDTGWDLIRGFLNGIKGAWKEVTGFLGDAASHLPGFIKGPLGIGSPSKVFKIIGVNVVEGLDVGLKRQFPQVQKRLGVMGDEFSKAFAPRTLSQFTIRPFALSDRSLEPVRSTIDAQTLENTRPLQLVQNFNGPIYGEAHLKRLAEAGALKALQGKTGRDAFVRNVRTGG